jgi:hypothetical protein
VDPEKIFIARQQPGNMFPHQPKDAFALTVLRPSLDNSPLNTSFNNGGILGSGVFCVIRLEAI